MLLMLLEFLSNANLIGEKSSSKIKKVKYFSDGNLTDIKSLRIEKVRELAEISHTNIGGGNFAATRATVLSSNFSTN